MRVAHVVPFIGAEASGPAYSVPALCRALASAGAQVALHVLAPAPPAPAGCDIHPHARWPIVSSLGFSGQMRAALAEEARRADVLHNHSLWMMPNVYPAWAVRGTRCRLVTSPRGTLSDWALGRSGLKKKAFWHLLQAPAAQGAACLHATAESEYEEIRRFGLTAPVAIIPNGMDLPGAAELERLRAEAPQGPRTLLFLSRVHPKKGVDSLLRAWRALQGSFADWELVVAGPDEGGHGVQLQRLAAELGAERVRFVGPLYGAAKRAELARAQLFVLPTHSENFGLVVAEALAHGVPAVVSKGAPWAGLVENRCGWWHDVGDAPLEAALREAMAVKPAALREMGARGRAWVERDFSWSGVGERMLRTYEWLLGGGAAPGWVRAD